MFDPISYQKARAVESRLDSMIKRSNNMVGLVNLVYDGYITPSGTWQPATTHKTTGFINIQGIREITFTGVLRYALYDGPEDEPTLITVTPGLSPDAVYTRSLPPEAKYIRFVVPEAHYDRVQVNVGSQLLDYDEAIETHFDPNLIQLKEKSVEKRHLSDRLYGEYGDIIDRKTLFGIIARSKPRLHLPQPMLIISYDDNPEQDYTLAFPVHQAYGVPGEVCVITDLFFGRKADLYNHNSLTIEQLREMEDAGWEVVSHSKRHTSLGFNTLSAPTPKGSYLWRPGEPSRWSRNLGYQVKVFDRRNPDEYDLVTIIDTTEVDGIEYLVSDTPATIDHIHGLDTFQVFTMSEASLYEEIVGSTEELRQLGFDCTSISYPYNATSPWSRAMVRKHLASGRSGNHGKLGNYMDTTNDYLPTAQLRAYAESTRWTAAEIDAMLDELVAHNALGIIFEHSWSVNFSTDGLDYLIRTAIEKGVKITTRKEALKYHGNRLEYGDPQFDMPYLQGDPYYVINAAGKEFDGFGDP